MVIATFLSIVEFFFTPPTQGPEELPPILTLFWGNLAAHP